MELQRLAPYAALVAERAWLRQADANESLGFVDSAISMAPSRAIYGELHFRGRALALDMERSDGAGLADPYRALLAGNCRRQQRGGRNSAPPSSEG